jgi:nodulation protein E
MQKRRVVITGIGITSGFGLGMDVFWNNVIQGKSAVKPLSLGDTLRMSKGATLDDYCPEDHFTARDLPLLDRFSQLAILASKEALADSGNEVTELNNIGVVIGSGNGGKHTDDESYKRFYGEGKTRVHPFMIPKGMHSAATSNVCMFLGLNGPSMSVSSACSSGAHGVIQGAMMIQSNICDAVLCGGSDAPFSFGILHAWDALRVVTNDLARPFSKDRSGMILGEGSAMFMLEDYQHAIDRGARIYAEVKGYGMSADAGHITDPDIDGIMLALRRALSDAGTVPAEIDYINAHGTGTRANDATESKAIRQVFGPDALSPMVSATKPLHGHALGGSSALEIAVCVKAIEQSIIPPTINITEVDEECQLNIVRDETIHSPVSTAMSNSFAFGGLNTVTIFSRID